MEFLFGKGVVSEVIVKLIGVVLLINFLLRILSLLSVSLQDEGKSYSNHLKSRCKSVWINCVVSEVLVTFIKAKYLKSILVTKPIKEVMVSRCYLFVLPYLIKF